MHSAFTQAGFRAEQADIVIKALHEAFEGGVATKADIAELATATKADFAELTNATKADIAELASATKADITALSHEISSVRTEMKLLRKDMTIKMYVVAGALAAFMLGLPYFQKVLFGGMV